MALKIEAGGFSERQARQTQRQQQQHSGRACTYPRRVYAREGARPICAGIPHHVLRWRKVCPEKIYALTLEAPEELLAPFFYRHNNFLCTPLVSRHVLTAAAQARPSRVARP